MIYIIYIIYIICIIYTYIYIILSSRNIFVDDVQIHFPPHRPFLSADKCINSFHTNIYIAHFVDAI